MENAPEQLRPPITVEAERFVVEGLKIIKKGDFGKANIYFRNSQKARKFGLDFDQDPRCYIVNGTVTKEKEEAILRFCLENSFFYHGEKEKAKLPLITIADVHTRESGEALPQTLLHEMALISAEEWVHALQLLKGGPLSGKDDVEVDVVAYFAQQGIPLTKSFLSRYQRLERLR